MARMGVGGYGIRSTMSSKDLENLPDDIVKKAKKSQEKQEKQAKQVRSLYKPKIKKLKKKVEDEFSQQDVITHGNVKLYGRGDQVSKDLILIKYTLATKKHRREIFNKILEFIQEAIRRAGLDEFFIVRNFGDQEPKDNDNIELLFLKQNHTWERIKNKPYIVQPEDEEGEAPPEPGGGAPGGPPSPGGGFGEAPPEGPPEGGVPQAGGEPEPEAGGGEEAGGEET